MRALHKRPRADTLSSEPRRTAGHWARFIYIGILVLVGVGIFNFLWGDLFLFRADGLVVRDRAVVAASALSQVKQVDIQEGATVARGDVLMKIESSEMLERLADLSLRLAELTQTDADLSMRIATADQLLPLAERREREAAEIFSGLEKAQSANLVDSARYFEALNYSYDAKESHIRLAAETATLAQQRASLSDAHTDAVKALGDLRALYANGVITAPIDGTIGGRIPSIGDVFQAGNAMLSIYAGTPYVLAYLPPRYLFPISVGMRVEIAGGRKRVKGIISEILPLTEPLPEEFQTSFRPRDRSQIARIKLDDAEHFPLFDKVSVSALLLGF